MIQKDTRWTKELTILSDIIGSTPLEKDIKWGAEVFTFNGQNVVSYGGFKHHFAIWFYNGVFLTDPLNKLVAAQSKTKSMRQWRFTSMDEIDATSITQYILEAIEVEKKGLKVKADTFTPVTAPDILLKAFDVNETLKTNFYSLTPGRQKEYIQYILEAKQEVTQLKRIEKITPLILDGKGLNDKYK